MNYATFVNYDKGEMFLSTFRLPDAVIAETQDIIDAFDEGALVVLCAQVLSESEEREVKARL